MEIEYVGTNEKNPILEITPSKYSINVFKIYQKFCTNPARWWLWRVNWNNLLQLLLLTMIKHQLFIFLEGIVLKSTYDF